MCARQNLCDRRHGLKCLKKVQEGTRTQVWRTHTPHHDVQHVHTVSFSNYLIFGNALRTTDSMHVCRPVAIFVCGGPWFRHQLLSDFLSNSPSIARVFSFASALVVDQVHCMHNFSCSYYNVCCLQVKQCWRRVVWTLIFERIGG